MPITSARVARSRTADAPGAAPSQRLPVAGVIRAGIKVLTQAAAKVDGARAIYERGVAAGASFDDIAKELGKLPGIPKTPLTPKNVPYFTARPGDFRNPAHAKQLLDLYGEQRDGDPVRRLYGFPIVLPSEDMDLMFPEGFEAWSASELMRWSRPNPETGFLDCMRRDPLPPKAGRRFGGRPVVVDRVCDPNDCPLFASGKCKHQGELYFWVPGVASAELFKISFTSVYAPLQIAPTLDLVRGGLGRVSGLYNGEPMFRVQKEHQRVASVNPDTGQPEKQAQWIITMSATIDMLSVLRRQQQPALAAPAETAALPAPVVPTDAPPAADAAAPDQRAELMARMRAAQVDIGWNDQSLTEWVMAYHAEAAQDTDTVRKLAAVVPSLESLAAGLAELTELRRERPAIDDAWDDWATTKIGGPNVVYDPEALPRIVAMLRAVPAEGVPG